MGDLTGGVWRTTDDGDHIYIKDGQVVAGLGKQAGKGPPGGSKGGMSHEAWKASLGDHHVKSIQAWTKGSDQKIRQAQLDGTGDPKILSHIKNIHEALDSAPAPGGTMYRGMKNLSEEDVKHFTTTGNTVHFKAFSSWTKNPLTSTRFALQGNKSGAVQMVVHRNTRGADISHLSKFEHESEVLLKSGASYRVVSHEVVKKLDSGVDATLYGLKDLAKSEEDVHEIGRINSREAAIAYVKRRWRLTRILTITQL